MVTVPSSSSFSHFCLFPITQNLWSLLKHLRIKYSNSFVALSFRPVISLEWDVSSKEGSAAIMGVHWQVNEAIYSVLIHPGTGLRTSLGIGSSFLFLLYPWGFPSGVLSQVFVLIICAKLPPSGHLPPCVRGFLVLLLHHLITPTRTLPSSPQSWQSLCPVQPFFFIPHHFTQFQDLYPGLSQQHSPLSNPSSVNTRRIEITHCPMDEEYFEMLFLFHYKCYWMVKLFKHVRNTLMKVNQFIIFDSSRIISK